MNDQETLYLSFIKNDIEAIKYIQNDQERIAQVNQILKDLCHIAEEDTLLEIKQFNDTNNKIEKRRWEIAKEVDELNKKILENYKNMYEKILLKL